MVLKRASQFLLVFALATILNYSGHLIFALSFKVEGNQYLLLGDCEDIKHEIKSFNSKQNIKIEREGVKCKADIKNIIPAKYTKLHGLSFNSPGPNCFSTAILGAGLIDSFRGVDIEEFKEILKRQCDPTDTPQMGDIGVFIAPGEVIIHAYTYLSNAIVLEKSGVDYLGKTRVEIQGREQTFFNFEAPRLCRQFSPKGDRSCYNKHRYYHCGPEKKQASLTLKKRYNLKSRINKSLDQLLMESLTKAKKTLLYDRVTRDIREYERVFLRLSKEDGYYKLVKARLGSFQEQLQFIKKP